MSQISLPAAAPLPLELRKELTQLDLRLRWVNFVRGCGRLMFVILVLTAIWLSVDLFFPLSATLRMAGLVLLIALAAWLGYHWLIRPLLRQRRWAELAYLIDRSFPDLQERVSSTVELAMLAEEQKGLASEFMQERLRRETSKRLTGLDLWDCLSLQSMAIALFAGLLTALALAAPLLFYSGGYSLLWQRLLTPWQNLDSATNLTFVVEQGDRIVPRGEDLLIQARPEWRYHQGELPREIRLDWQDERGLSSSREMSYDARRGMYVGKIPQVMSPLSYHLSSRGAHSRHYHVRVADRPRILDVQLTVIPPPYTGQEQTVHQGAMGTIRAIQGSRLVAELAFEYPVTQLSWNWNTKRRPASASETPAVQTDASSSQENMAQPSVVEGKLSEDGLSARVEVQADQTDGFQFVAVSRDQLKNQGEPQRIIQVIADRAPRIDLTGSEEPLKVRPDEIIAMELLADDDFGVVEMQLVVEHLSDGRESPQLLEWTSAVTGPTNRQVHDRYELNLGPLNLKNGDILGYRAVARDGRPVPRPNETWTARRVLLINKDVLSLAGQEVEDFYERMRRQAELVKSEVASHRKAMERQRGELDPKPRDEASKVLQENKTEWLQQKLALSLQLDDLSGKLQERPMTAALAQMNSIPAQNLIDQAAEQLEKYEKGSKQDPLEQIRKDESAVREAENLLNRLVNQLRDAERIEKELAQLEQLARRSRELARQAEQIKPDSSAPPADEEKKSAEQPEQTPLDQLQQEYAALTHDLEELLKHRPELKQAAKNAMLGELSNISEQAEQLTKSQRELTAELEQEQQAQLAGQETLARSLQETRQLARELAEQSEQNSGNNAAPVFNADPAAAAFEEQQQANQGKTREALQAAQAALERFEQGREAPALSADPQQTARELAEQSRQLQQQAEKLQQLNKQWTEQQRKAREQAQRDKQPVSTEVQESLEIQRETLQAEQERLAEKLAGLKQAVSQMQLPTPQQQMRQELTQRLEQTSDELAQLSDRVDDRLKETAAHFERLAKSIGTPSERAAKADKQLEAMQKRSDELSRQIEQLQDKQPAEVESAQQAIIDQLHEQVRQLLAQDSLGHEKELAETVRKSLQAEEALKTGQVIQALQKQQEMSSQLGDLQKQIQTAPAVPQPSAEETEQVWNEVPLSDGQKKIRFPENPTAATEPTEEKLNEMLSQLQQLQEKTQQAVENNREPEKRQQLTNQLNQLAGEQKQLADQTEKMSGAQAALPRMQAQQALREATEALQMGDARQARTSQQQAARRLEQIREQLSGSTQTSQPEPADTTSEQTAKLAADLKQKLQALSDQMSGSAPAPTDPQDTESENPPSPASGQQQTNPEDLLAQLQALQESQQRLADQASQLAAQSQAQTPDKTELQQKLSQAAEQAEFTSQKLMSGQLDKAAEHAGQVEQQLQQAAKEQALPEASQAAIQQAASQQKQLAEQMKQLAENRQAGPLLRQKMQSQISEQTDRLTQALQQLAGDARSKPFDDKHLSDQTQKLSQQSGQAVQAMQQSQAASQQENLQTSANQSRQAQEQLQSLSNQSARLSGLKSETLVPEPVGAEATQAAQMLNQAQASLEQARQKAMEQSQAAQQSQGQSTPAQPQDSQPSSNPLEQLAQQLAQAAQSLESAHRQLQPRQQSSSEMAQQQQSPASQGRPEELSDANTGAPSAAPAMGPMTGEILRSAIMRDWGQQQEKLETDLTDARRRAIDQEYAPLIQRYFESLAAPDKTAP